MACGQDIPNFALPGRIKEPDVECLKDYTQLQIAATIIARCYRSLRVNRFLLPGLKILYTLVRAIVLATSRIVPVYAQPLSLGVPNGSDVFQRTSISVALDTAWNLILSILYHT